MIEQDTGEQAGLDPAVRGFALLTATAFTVELMLAMTLSQMDAERATGTAGAMFWNGVTGVAAVPAELASSDTMHASGQAVQRLFASALARSQNVRSLLTAAAVTSAMATVPPSGTVN